MPGNRKSTGTTWFLVASMWTGFSSLSIYLWAKLGVQGPRAQEKKGQARKSSPRLLSKPLFAILYSLSYCVTGGAGGAFGAFRCGVFGVAGGPATDGGGGGASSLLLM